jgi:hypothetical protein
MLSICSNNHEDVAYDEDYCSVCHEKYRVEEIESEMSALLAEKDALRDRILFLEGAIAGHNMTVEDLNEKIERPEYETAQMTIEDMNKKIGPPDNLGTL